MTPKTQYKNLYLKKITSYVLVLFLPTSNVKSILYHFFFNTKTLNPYMAFTHNLCVEYFVFYISDCLLKKPKNQTSLESFTSYESCCCCCWFFSRTNQHQAGVTEWPSEEHRGSILFIKTNIHVNAGELKILHKSSKLANFQDEYFQFL